LLAYKLITGSIINVNFDLKEMNIFYLNLFYHLPLSIIEAEKRFPDEGHPIESKCAEKTLV